MSNWELFKFHFCKNFKGKRLARNVIIGFIFGLTVNLLVLFLK